MYWMEDEEDEDECLCMGERQKEDKVAGGVVLCLCFLA